MDAIDYLLNQHDEVRKLFDQIQDLDGLEAEGLFRELADRLAVHATVEERLFYPALKGGDLDELLFRSLEEHLSAKRLVADLLEQDLSPEVFRAKVEVLCEQMLEHIDVEEKEVLPKARQLLEPDVRIALAQEMAALQTELEETGAPREDVLEQRDTAPPL